MIHPIPGTGNATIPTFCVRIQHRPPQKETVEPVSRLSAPDGFVL